MEQETDQEHQLWNQVATIQVQNLADTSCVILTKLLNLSLIPSSIKQRIVATTQICCCKG